MGTQDFDRFEGYTEHKGDTMSEASRIRYGCDKCKDQDCPTTRFDGWGGETLWLCHACIFMLTHWTTKERA